jgi:hypothetical protein
MDVLITILLVAALFLLVGSFIAATTVDPVWIPAVLLGLGIVALIGSVIALSFYKTDTVEQRQAMFEQQCDSLGGMLTTDFDGIYSVCVADKVILVNELP